MSKFDKESGFLVYFNEEEYSALGPRGMDIVMPYTPDPTVSRAIADLIRQQREGSAVLAQSPMDAEEDPDTTILRILPEAERQLESVIEAYDEAAKIDFGLALRLDARRDQIRESANTLRKALGRRALTA